MLSVFFSQFFREKHVVPPNKTPYYEHWVACYHHFYHEYSGDRENHQLLEKFVRDFETKVEDWQVATGAGSGSLVSLSLYSF